MVWGTPCNHWGAWELSLFLPGVEPAIGSRHHASQIGWRLQLAVQKDFLLFPDLMFLEVWKRIHDERLRSSPIMSFCVVVNLLIRTLFITKPLGKTISVGFRWIKPPSFEFYETMGRVIHYDLRKKLGRRQSLHFWHYNSFLQTFLASTENSVT